MTRTCALSASAFVFYEQTFYSSTIHLRTVQLQQNFQNLSNALRQWLIWTEEYAEQDRKEVGSQEANGRATLQGFCFDFANDLGSKRSFSTSATISRRSLFNWLYQCSLGRPYMSLFSEARVWRWAGSCGLFICSACLSWTATDKPWAILPESSGGCWPWHAI